MLKLLILLMTGCTHYHQLTGGGSLTQDGPEETAKSMLMQSSEPAALPGIDVLSSGFDAAEWKTKYKIFDLSEPGDSVLVKSIGKSYVAPKFVSVSADGPNSKRVEDSCVSVATHFMEYVHTYQESVSFDIGIQSKAFSLGIAAHHDVKEVYEAIDRYGQAIGVSESWWGMFEASLPPAFLMTSKMTPMFVQTRDVLKNIGAPKTEADQMVYNQVCCGPSGFGTHYVGSIIAGAKTTVTTFVNNSFHSEYTESTVRNQVSIGFQWKKLKLSLGHDADDFEKKLIKDFKNSSHQRITFQPDLKTIYEDKAPWNRWEVEAVNHPIAVNTSVSSLANLFFDAPDVMSHMQKTIDFYMLNNRPPKLSELQPALSFKSLLFKTKPRSIVPGLSVVGCGFDAPSLSSKLCVFGSDVSKGSTIWSNPYYPDISYVVPKGFYAMNTPESLTLNSTIVLTTVDDYISKTLYTEHHHHSGFLGFGSKDETKTTRRFYRNFYAQNYRLALSMRQIAWYTLKLIESPLPKYNPVFLMALDFLPETYNPQNASNVQLFELFFNSFGTDVVTETDMGGMVWAEDWYESCLSKIYSDICITEEVRRGYWFVHHSHDSEKCDKRIIHDLKPISEHHLEILGGGTSGAVNKTEWDQWVLSVKHDPRPIKLTLAPIHYLLPMGHSKAAALKSATEQYLAKMEQQKKQKIEMLEALRPPPPSVCKKTRTSGFYPLPIGQYIDLFSNTQMTVNNAHQTLCPIVGYHGAYCPPGQTSAQQFLQFQALESSNQINLPRGVGLTLDVSTGDLKLPTLKYEGNVGTWTDPTSGQKFIIPALVSLSTASNPVENVPSVKVFKTEDELVQVWEQGYRNGNWLGGEFGNSKSMIGLYDKFFSKQQSMAVNQHPQALYRLNLSSGWEKSLNDFVKAALTTLPESYDINSYGRFMDTWGTHVATDTLVGGMREQQVVMKDCMWANPYLTSGLSDEQIHEFLKIDLSRGPPVDSFYMARRKMSIDHQIGGNPEVNDDGAWKAGLAKNPALLKIYSHVAWPNVAQASGLVSAKVVSNLQTAIYQRMTAKENERKLDKEVTAKKRIDELQGPRNVIAVVGHGRRGTIAPLLETGKYLTLKGYADCPPGLSHSDSITRCNTGLNIHSWNSVELIEPLRYERNAQGDMRSIRCFDKDHSGNCIHHYGPWVRNGCSLQPYANGNERLFHTPVPDRTVVAMVCADCEIITAGFPSDATLKCACPGFANVDQSFEQQLSVQPSLDPSRGTKVLTVSHPLTKHEQTLDPSRSNPMKTYKQCDPRWACYPYHGHKNQSSCTSTVCGKSNNICISGCGITCLAMVMTFYGHRNITPPIIADLMVEEGFRDDLSGTPGATCNGISHTAMCAAAADFGLTCNTTHEFDVVDDWLKEHRFYDGQFPAPVVAHVRHKSFHQCKFTRAGHYILVTDVSYALTKSGKLEKTYHISDPNSNEPDRKIATIDDFNECEVVGFIGVFPELR